MEADLDVPKIEAVTIHDAGNACDRVRQRGRGKEQQDERENPDHGLILRWLR